MRRCAQLWPAVLVLALSACPPAPEEPDSGEPEDGGEAPLDAGLDGGPEDAGAEEDAGFGPVPIEQWCASRALAECHRELRCLLLEPDRLDGCLERRGSGCDQAAYTGGVAQGRLEYSAEQAARCLNAHSRGSCSATPEECAGVFAGKVPPDGGCLLAEDCDSEGFCFLYSATCPFRCLPYVGLGETCDTWMTRCKPDAGTCQQDGGVRTCAPAKLEGEPCRYGDCAVGLTCYRDLCVKASARLGEPCNLVSPYPYCETEAFCRLGSELPDGGRPGTCQRKGGLGAVCAGYGACLPSLRCSSAFQTGTCEPLGAVGDTCSSYADCRNDLFCWDYTSRCAPLPEEGGDCTDKGSSYRCATGFFCDFSSPGGQYVCRAKKTLGESCTYSGTCLSNLCEHGAMADGGAGYRCVSPCSERVDGG